MLKSLALANYMIPLLKPCLPVIQSNNASIFNSLQRYSQLIISKNVFHKKVHHKYRKRQTLLYPDIAMFFLKRAFLHFLRNQLLFIYLQNSIVYNILILLYILLCNTYKQGIKEGCDKRLHLNDYGYLADFSFEDIVDLCIIMV